MDVADVDEAERSDWRNVVVSLAKKKPPYPVSERCVPSDGRSD